MQKKLTLILLLMTLFIQTTYASTTPSFEIVSNSAIVLEAETSQILYSKNQDQRLYPASITKVLTALIALEKGNLEDVVTVSEFAVNSIGMTSHIALVPGEKLTLRDAMYGMLLSSANDCAIAIAEHISGSVPEFVKLMNKKAKELGAVNSNFVNPHGLHSDDHYTTAFDMAIIVRESIKNPKYIEISGTKLYTMDTTNKQAEKRYFNNQNLMLHNGKYFYEYATTGKNGYTSNAKNTMVSTAKKGNLELICILMDCQDPYLKYTDAKSILSYSFDNFYKTKITADKLTPPTSQLMGLFGAIGKIDFKIDRDIPIILPNDATVEGLEYKYNIPEKQKKAKVYNGELLISKNGESLFNINLVGNEKYTMSFYNILKIIFYIIIALVIIFALIIAYYLLDAEKKKRNRRHNKYKRALKINKL
jgi:D-alanyl-D-alanine carboxypeptidase